MTGHVNHSTSRLIFARREKQKGIDNNMIDTLLLNSLMFQRGSSGIYLAIMFLYTSYLLLRHLII